jgi:hypothetical protein
VLELADQHGDDWRSFEADVRTEYFQGHATSVANQMKLANNTKLGMQAYGVIERNSARLTELGRELFDLRHDPEAMYQSFARHILLNRHGVTLVQCVQDMQIGGETVDLVKLRSWMSERGVVFPSGGRHPSTMRLWLEKAGVFSTGWNVNTAVLDAIIGVTGEEIEALARLRLDQRAYLKTLANVSGPGPYASNEIAKLAAATHQITFNEKNLPKDVLYPLRDAGYIALTRGTVAPGRGAKPFQVSPTAKLTGEVITPLLEQLERQTNADLRPFLRRSLADISSAVNDASASTHDRGLALEALAIRLMRLLDMEYRGTRLRGDATGGAEVDVIFESSRLVFSRWQLVCKRRRRIGLDEVAIGVGRTYLTNSNALVYVTTGAFDPAARRYARVVSADSHLRVMLIDGRDIASVAHDPSAIFGIIAREGASARPPLTLASPGSIDEGLGHTLPAPVVSSVAVLSEPDASIVSRIADRR